MTIQKIATWLPVTEEALADAPLIRVSIEYMMAPETPLSPLETMTGWRSFTSSEGYTGRFKVGWRKALHDTMLLFAREAWPEDYADDDD